MNRYCFILIVIILLYIYYLQILTSDKAKPCAAGSLLPSVLTDGSRRDKKYNASVGLSPFPTRIFRFLLNGVETRRGRSLTCCFLMGVCQN